MYVFLFLLILMYILFYCSFFTNIVGLLTMIVYFIFIHLIFCLSLMFCEFKFSFHILDLYCNFHTCVYDFFECIRNL